MTGTILWLTGWSMPDTVFDSLRSELPDFDHVSVDYSQSDTPEEIFERVEYAAAEHSGQAFFLRKPLLIAGWSLGALLALRLAALELADGLVLLAGTARFTRPKDRKDLGWPDAYVRQMIASIAKDRQSVEALFRRSLFTEAEWEAGLDAQLPPVGSWSGPALIAGLHILRNEDYISRLPAIHCPILLLHGHDDKVCPYGAAEEIAARAKAQVKVIAWTECGHVPFVGREIELAEAIRSWWHERQSKQDPASI